MRAVTITSHELAEAAGERCAKLYRVSSDSQDTVNQYADVETHIAARKYAVAKTFELEDVSASKGKQEAVLEGILADIRAGLYSVVVVAHSSRLDRRDPDVVALWQLLVKQAGGRIESYREPEFGVSGIGGDIMGVVSRHLNYQYSKALSDNTKAGQARKRATGSFVGSVPWGYAVATDAAGFKTLVPTMEGAEFIPALFLRAAKGDSLRSIAAWLTVSGAVPTGKHHVHGPGWYARTVQLIVRNTCYYGVKNNGAGMTVECPPLVDIALWTRANDALRRNRSHRGAVVQDKAMLTTTLLCANPACDGAPMYRIQPSAVRADGRTVKTPYMRCAGRKGPDATRRSCGNMVRMDVVDALAVRLLSRLSTNVTEELPAVATTRETQLATLRQERKHLDDSRPDYDDRHAALTVRIKELQLAPDAPAAPQLITHTYTYAQQTAGMSPTALGQWLRDHHVRMYASKSQDAVQRFSDAATGALVAGDRAAQYALEHERGVWLAVRI